MSEVPPLQIKSRKIITTACNPCRRRKSRCDGGEPVCEVCVSYKTTESCSYDKQSDKRRLRTKQQAEQTTSRLHNLEAVFHRLRTCPDEDVLGLVAKIRINAARPVDEKESSVKSEAEDETSRLVEDLHIDEDGEVHFYGPSSNLPLIGDTSNMTRIRSRTTRASFSHRSIESFYEPRLVDHLLDLYWTYQHPQFALMDKTLFLRDRQTSMKPGYGGQRLKFFSEFLLSAMLAYMSHFYLGTSLRTDPSDPTSAGEVYYLRCRELIDDETLRPSLSTVQACLILGSREGGLNRLSRGWLYAGMAFRIALDLGLNVDCSKLVVEGKMSKEELYVRSLTWWGAFKCDVSWSAYIGRPSSLPMTSSSCPRPSTVPMPSAQEPHDLRDSTVLEQKLVLFSLLQQVISLAANAKEDARLSLWTKLKAWRIYNDGEEAYILHNEVDVGPDVLFMHLLYETTLIFLFRNFSTAASTKLSFVNARTECLLAADRSVKLLLRYQKEQGLKRITNMGVHLVFTVATAYLIVILDDVAPNYEHYTQLGLTLDFLREIEQTWSGAITPRRGILSKLKEAGRPAPPLSTSPTSWSELTEVSPNDLGNPIDMQSSLWSGYTANSYVAHGLQFGMDYESGLYLLYPAMTDPAQRHQQRQPRSSNQTSSSSSSLQNVYGSFSIGAPAQQQPAPPPAASSSASSASTTNTTTTLPQFHGVTRPR